MKKSNDHLFDMIKSLDTQEKVYIKVHLRNKNRGENTSSYVKLFDILNNMDEFDSGILKEKLKKNNVIINLKRAKEHLNDAVLKHLTDFHTESDVNIKIHTLSSQVEVLIKKELYNQAIKQYAKLYKLCIENEKYSLLLQSYFIISYLFKGQYFAESVQNETIKTYINSFIKNKKLISDYIKNDIEILNSKFLFEKINVGSQNEFENELFNILSNLTKNINSNNVSLISQNSYSYIYCLASNYNKNYTKKSIEIQNNWINKLKNLKKISQSENDYLKAKLRLIMSMLYQGSFVQKDFDNELFSVIQYYQSIESKRKTVDIKNSLALFCINYQHISLCLNNTENAIKIKEIINEYVPEKEIKNTEHKIIYNFNLAYAYLLNKDYKETLKTIHHNITLTTKVRPDQLANSYWIYIIGNYEKGNLEQLKYICNSAKMFFVKNKIYGNYEKTIIDFFCNNTLSINKNKKEIWFTLKKTLSKHKPKYIIIDTLFDFNKWVDLKLNSFI